MNGTLPASSLIIRHGALGDVLMLLPLVQALKTAQMHPVSLAVPSSQTGLLSGFEGVGETHSTDSLELWRLYGPEPASLRLPACDRIFAFVKSSDRSVQAALSQACPKARVEVIPPFPDSGYANHVSAYYLGQVFPETPVPRVWPRYQAKPKDLEAVSLLRRDTLGADPAWAIQPGSGSPVKNWPVERFAETADYLSGLGRRVFLILGPVEAVDRDSWIRAFSRISPVLIENWDLPRLAALLSGCEGYLGNDSGVTHLAAILGVPTVAIFGPTRPELWAPRGNCVQVVSQGRGIWPDTRTVINSVESVRLQSRQFI